jgi:hypothetical protein
MQELKECTFQPVTKQSASMICNNLGGGIKIYQKDKEKESFYENLYQDGKLKV